MSKSNRDLLLDACSDHEKVEVRQFLQEGSLTADDATAALRWTLDHPGILRCLLEYGAKADSVMTRKIRNFESPKVLHEFGFDVKPQGHIILQHFADDKSALDWLLDQGVDINTTDSSRLDDGFHLAIGEYDHSLHVMNLVAANGDVQLFNHLVSRGAKPSKSLALHSVSRCHDPERSIAMLSCLLDKHHMDINADTDTLRDFRHDAMDSGTPLCTAIYNNNLPVVQELIARGADVESSGESGDKPISKAVGESLGSYGEGFPPAIAPLIEAGVDAALALFYAVGQFKVEAAKICLECGADPVPALKQARQKDADLQAKNTAERSERNNDFKRARSQNMIELLGNWSKG